MTDPLPPTEPPQKESPDALVLRGRPRPAVRFRRGLIVGITGAVAAALVTLSWFALEPPSFRKAAAPIEGDEPSHKAAPDALANAPTNYGDVPRLGPPLPGDLGRAIVEQQRSLEVAQPGTIAAAGADPAQAAAEAERQRMAAARQAARSSAVLVQLEGPKTSAPSAESGLQAEPAAAVPEPAPAAVPASQQRKIEFVRSSEGDQNPHELRPAPSPWTLSAGSVIPASLITGLNSDLPGTVLAQVSENVRDSATGRTVLIPQGARLVGRYDSAVTYGQRRALLVWERILFPNGASLDLDKMPAADASGYGGLEGDVNSHPWQLLKGVLLSSVLGLGNALSFGGSDVARAIAQSGQQNGTRAGEQLVGRALDVQPTLTVRPGWPVRVIVSKDLVIQPWREQ